MSVLEDVMLTLWELDVLLGYLIITVVSLEMQLNGVKISYCTSRERVTSLLVINLFKLEDFLLIF